MFVSPTLENRKNSGSAVAVPGTSTPPSTNAYTALRPGKRYFASAYPAATAKYVASTEPTPEYRSELSAQREKIPPLAVNTALRLSNSRNSLPNQKPLVPNRSSVDFVAFTITQ